MNVGAHSKLFCSAMQFKAWHKLLVGEVEDVVKEDNVLDTMGARCQGTTVFELVEK